MTEQKVNFPEYINYIIYNKYCVCIMHMREHTNCIKLMYIFKVQYTTMFSSQSKKKHTIHLSYRKENVLLFKLMATRCTQQSARAVMFQDFFT